MDFPPYVFPHADWFPWAVGLLIVVLLLVRVSVARRRARSHHDSGD